MGYILKEYISAGELLSSDLLELSSFHWEADEPYRPLVLANVGIVNGELVAVLKAYETDPRAVCLRRDDPVYTDSCLELFVALVEGRAEYVNVECNSKGVFLSEFGSGKFNRRLVRDITALSPEVTPFVGSDSNGSYWGVSVALSKSFVAEVYGVDVSDVTFNSVKLNFYKCGDCCEVAHYAAFSPVTTLPPGFHNPDCFVEFKKEN